MSANVTRIQIGVIANNDRTVSDLLSYFAKVGIDASRQTELCEKSDNAPPLHAIIIFPDDYDLEVIDRLLTALGKREPTLLQLIVTRQPQRFSAPVSPPRLIMPRPTFGWAILDAIRGYMDGGGGQEA